MRFNNIVRCLFIITLVCCFMLCVAACSSGGGDSGSDGSGSGDIPADLPAGQREFTLEGTTDDSGIAAVTFTVPSDSTKLSVSAFSRGAVRFSQLSDSRGVDYLMPGGQTLSLSTLFTPDVSTVIAPSRGLDPALEGNQAFSAAAQTDLAGANRSILFQVLSKADGDLLNGLLRVTVFRIAAVSGDPGLDAAVATALAEFQSIYGQAAGVQVAFDDRVVDGPVTLPFPFEGAELYRELSESAVSPAVNLVIGGNVDGLGDEILGIAGGIPGPPVPSSRSAVAVSLLSGAGPDGIYSTAETNILAETMAHEVGHFMGLFHPIELDSPADADPLSDTPGCDVAENCGNNRALAANLMFPTPVADESGAPVRQNQLTAQQREVLNRYIAVD